MNDLGSPSGPVMILDQVGFKLEHKQENEPCRFIDTGRKCTRPGEDRRIFVERVDGTTPIFINIKAPVDNQERVDNPFERLLRTVKSRCGN